MRRSFASRHRQIATVFATIFWFHELRLRLDASTVVAVRRAVEPAEGGLEREAAVSRRWRDYRDGRHAPSASVIALAETLYPGTRQILQSPVWDALRLDRRADQIGLALMGSTSRLGDELLTRMLGQIQRKSNDPRWLRKRCTAMVERGSLEGLAVLTICMRLAGAANLDRLALTFYRYSTRCLLVLGGSLYDHGIAQGVAEYYELVLLPKCCREHWMGSFSSAHYLHSVHGLQKVL